MSDLGSPAPWMVQLDPVDGPPLTNYVTNPSFEYGTTGWATTDSGAFLTAGAAIAQTADAYSDTHSLQVTASAAATHEGAALPGLAGPPGGWQAGVTYNFSIYLRSVSGATALEIDFGTASDHGSAAITINNQWTRYNVNWTPAGNQPTAEIVVRTTTAAAAVWNADAAMVVQDNKPNMYFDGDGLVSGTHWSPASYYQWTGTPGSSTSTRTNLRETFDLNTDGGGRIDTQGIDWGDAAIQPYEAQLRIGSQAVDYQIPNRTVTIPLGLGMDETGTEEDVRRQLEEKVGLLHREGGVLLRQRAMGDPMFADIVTATLNIPDVWGETGGVEPSSHIMLECLPDFYGVEKALDQLSGTGEIAAALTENGQLAVIGGDYPARSRLIVADTSGNDQQGLLWGVRSRHYDPAATAALVYEAEAMTPINGSAVVSGVSGASGGEVIQINPLQPSTWHPFMITDLVSPTRQLTHVGTYNVWARMSCVNGTPQVRLAWSADDTVAPTYNDIQTVPAADGNFYLVYLGTVRLKQLPVGAWWWRGVILGYTDATDWGVSVDKLWLQPIDEGAGRVDASQQDQAFVLKASAAPSITASTLGTSGGTVGWTNAGGVDVLNNKYAQAVLGGSAYSYWLEATGFGFAIPAGATIQRIKVEVAYTTQNGMPFHIGLNPQLIVGGTVETASGIFYVDENSWSGNEWVGYHGSPTKWGVPSLTVAQINASNFGVALQAWNRMPNASVTAMVDYILVTITYWTAGGFLENEDAVIFGSRRMELRTEGAYREDLTSTAFVPLVGNFGNMLRIPPSGLEGRPTHVLVKPTESPVDSGYPDWGIDGLTVRPLYRPCYLGRI